MPSALAGLHVDGQLDFCGLLHQKISGLRAPENFVDAPVQG
jgi:hypothetical protein